MKPAISFPGNRANETVYWTIHLSEDNYNGKFYVYMDGKKVWDKPNDGNMIEALIEFGKALENDEVDY